MFWFVLDYKPASEAISELLKEKYDPNYIAPNDGNAELIKTVEDSFTALGKINIKDIHYVI